MHLHSRSAEYKGRPSSSPFMLPSNNDFAPLSSSNTAALVSTPRASAPAYDGHLLPAKQPYQPFESPWNTQLYTAPPPSLAYTPTWMSSSIEYGSRLAPRQENYYFWPPVNQAVFEPATSPYHHPREVLPNTDSYIIGSAYSHFNSSQSKTSSTTSVSLPNPSSYCQGHHPGPH